ncbi:MAG TPA: hypothetical protein VH436_23795 [Vicinamibacterales bacterium]|jgi:hypothetical protein
MTELDLLVTLGCGGIAGALNAALSDRGRLLPSFVTLSPGGTRVLRVGVIGNIAAGGASALCLCSLLQVAGATLSAQTGFNVVLHGLFDFFMAFVSVRFVTNEVDKLVLRSAVFKAASAPAAHPDVVGEMQVATPYALYILVDRLLPRRAGHR